MDDILRLIGEVVRYRLDWRKPVIFTCHRDDRDQIRECWMSCGKREWLVFKGKKTEDGALVAVLMWILDDGFIKRVSDSSE